MTEQPIKTRKVGGILEVTIDRPKANAIDLATSRIMGDVFADFRDDPDMRVAILTSASEKFFCPGWDLKAASNVDGSEGDAVDGDYGVGCHSIARYSVENLFNDPGPLSPCWIAFIYGYFSN